MTPPTMAPVDDESPNEGVEGSADVDSVELESPESLVGSEEVSSMDLVAQAPGTRVGTA